jgi:hypothetical protein
MKLVTNKLKSGGLHEKHVVAPWNFGNRLSFAYRPRETKKNLKETKKNLIKKKPGNQEKPLVISISEVYHIQRLGRKGQYFAK